MRRMKWKTRSEEHTSELQSHHDLVCRLLLEKKKMLTAIPNHIVETFGVGAAALYLDYKQKFYHSGTAIHFSEDEMRRAMLLDEPLIDPNRSLSFSAVRMGARAIGSLGISGRRLSRETL